MRHLELFAGVGGFRTAMEYVCNDLHIPLQNIGYSEIDDKASQSYCANYNTKGEMVLGDIVEFINDKERFDKLPDFDLLSGGFPCQTFSMMGSQKGFAEDRGQMFFRIMDIVNAKHPRYILLENVKNLVSHDHGNTLGVIQKTLQTAGYVVHYDIFNTAEFGLPQTRNRTIIFCRRKRHPEINELEDGDDFEFSFEQVKKSFNDIDRNQCSLRFYKNVLDILETNVEEQYYLSERIKPTILADGSGGFKSKSDIDQIIARPLTASMHKMHRACQDNYYSDLFVQSKGENRPVEKMNKQELAKLRIRKLTPKEAFMLQGFPSDFSAKSLAKGVANGAQYKQAGNAVSVNTIYSILYYLIRKGILE